MPSPPLYRRQTSIPRSSRMKLNGGNDHTKSFGSAAAKSRAQHAILLALTMLAVLTPVPPAWAQKDTGAITGTVRDASKAVIPAATVRVTDVDRGAELVVTTNAAGEYVASPLKVGRYTITVEKAGFKKTVTGP